MILSTIFFSRRVRKAYRKTRKTIGKVSSDLEQNISGVKVAQAFNREKQNIQTFQQVNEANRQANVNAELFMERLLDDLGFEDVVFTPYEPKPNPAAAAQ